MRLNFKLHNDLSQTQRKRALRQAKNLGADVQAMFPDEEDEELALLYKAEAIPNEQLEQTIQALNSLPEVEFAEQTPEHKLIW